MTGEAHRLKQWAASVPVISRNRMGRIFALRKLLVAPDSYYAGFSHRRSRFLCVGPEHYLWLRKVLITTHTVYVFLLLIFVLTPVASLAAQDYAAWSKKNLDGSWTRTAEIAVATSSLPSLEPKDIGKFCPTYKRLPREKRIRFWVGLISVMARPESDFNPEAASKGPSKDRFGKRGINRGLLQISIESANQPGYGCGIKKAKDLHDPAIHLPCAVKILSTWVTADHVVASYKGHKKNRGGGRYWAVLREKNGRLPEISNFTKNLSFCRNG